ncbi:HET-domain-containing protein [Periconia macrospinosa]|uniref:HET-domain-containing protein n=1 Tax=Periconia macrospinosa TaxID=97972 RepID=A0A2V1DTQ8_9PLEO|nr:HET-domain-containing protein [Periconia macrospinosa]
MPLLSFLEESAGNRCCFCALLYKKVSEHAKLFGIPDRISLNLIRNRRLVGCNFQRLTDGVAEDGIKQTTTHYGEPNLYLAPLSKQLAKSWLAKCKQSHEGCVGAVSDSSWRPTRLSDLQFATGPNGFIQVIDTIARTPRREYVCLSHCWGGHQPFTLTAETSGILRGGFPVSDLLRTFRDAVQVCHWFNIRYLWIDSLCIVPDSRQDWEREAARMKLVYKNGEFTIAATDGQNCESGLFRNRIPAGTVTPIFEVDQLDSLTETEKKAVGILDSEMWSRGVEGAHLNTRAWVLQERLLSLRVLHFGQDQLFWECKSLRACETFPNYFPALADKLSQSMFKNMSHFEQLQYSGQYDKHLSACLWQWGTIYEAYIRSKLTHQNDRVIALAGAAEEIQGLLKTDYLAGLWRCRFEDQLAWKVRDPVHAQRAIPYRAPSSSWLAIDGEINPYEHTTLSKKVAKVLQVEVELTNPDFLTGEMKKGTIKANAHFQDLSWSIGWTGDVQFVIGKDQVPYNVSKGKFGLFWDTFPENTMLCAHHCQIAVSIPSLLLSVVVPYPLRLVGLQRH